MRTTMSADARRTRVLPFALLIACGVTLAADGELPEMEFLEYLGMWEESDEEWLVFADGENASAESDERIDPAPQGEESMENDDES